MLFYGPTQERVLATESIGRTRERSWKNAGEWTGKVETSSRKKSLAVGETCMTML